MNRSLALATVVFLGLAGFSNLKGDDQTEPSFTSKDAKLAQLKFDEEKKALDESYFKELAVIKKTYITGLNAARKTAIEKDNLNEAQGIAAYIKELEADSKELPDKGAKLNQKDLIGRKFLFSYSQKGHYYPVVMGKDGKLIGGQGSNECFWRVNPAGKFYLLGQDGKSISSLNYESYVNPKGLLMLSGRSNVDGKDALLYFQEHK